SVVPLPRDPSPEGPTGGDHRVSEILARRPRRVRQEPPISRHDFVRSARFAPWELPVYGELGGPAHGEALVGVHDTGSKRTYGSRPWRPPSRPKPLSLKPPNGEAGSN